MDVSAVASWLTQLGFSFGSNGHGPKPLLALPAPAQPSPMILVRFSLAAGFGVYEIWQEDHGVVAKSETPVFEARIFPEVPVGVIGREKGKAKPRWLPPVFSLVDLTSVPTTLAGRVHQASLDLGFELGDVGEGVAVLTTFDRKSEVVVGVHLTRPQAARALLNAKGGANPKIWRMTLTSEPVDPRPLRLSFAAARSQLPKSADYQKFLAVGEGAHTVRSDRVRKLIIAAPKSRVLGRAPGATTALVQAKPLKAHQWADLAHSVQRGEAWDENDSEAVRVQHPLLGAVVGEVIYHEDDFEIGREFYAMWEVTADAAELEYLFNLPVTIIGEFENLGGKRLWVKLLVTAKGTRQELARIERSLPRRHRVVPGVLGQNVRHSRQVRQSTLVGSPLALKASSFGVLDWKGYLEAFVAGTDGLGAGSGNLPFGWTRDTQRLVTYDLRATNSLLAVGIQGTGKTVWLQNLLYMVTPWVYTLHVARPSDQFTLRWAEKIGGKATRKSFAEPQTVEEFDAAVVDLEREVDGETRQILAKDDWTGELPRAVCFNGGSYALYLVYLRLILTRQLEALGKVAIKKGRLLAVDLEDILAAAEKMMDPKIGDRGEKAAAALISAVHVAVNTLRKSRVLVAATAQGVKSLAEVCGAGAFQDFAAGVLFTAEKRYVHARAQLFYPPDVSPDRLWEMKEAADLAENEESPDPWPGWRGFMTIDVPAESRDLMTVPK